MLFSSYLGNHCTKWDTVCPTGLIPLIDRPNNWVSASLFEENQLKISIVLQNEKDSDVTSITGNTLYWPTFFQYLTTFFFAVSTKTVVQVVTSTYI